MLDALHPDVCPVPDDKRPGKCWATHPAEARARLLAQLERQGEKWTPAPLDPESTRMAFAGVGCAALPAIDAGRRKLEAVPGLGISAG